MGRAADRPEWIIEPWMLIDILRVLAEILTRMGATDRGELAEGEVPRG